MTKEEIIEECKQRLGFETDCEMYSLCQHEKDFYNAIIEALEQPNEDCVSRQAVDKLCIRYLKTPTDENVRFYEEFCSLPPVAPTHGTCKDCKHFHNVRKNFNTCDLWTIACTDNHYCADFEKRGNEIEVD